VAPPPEGSTTSEFRSDPGTPHLRSRNIPKTGSPKNKSRIRVTSFITTNDDYLSTTPTTQNTTTTPQRHHVETPRFLKNPNKTSQTHPPQKIRTSTAGVIISQQSQSGRSEDARLVPGQFWVTRGICWQQCDCSLHVSLNPGYLPRSATRSSQLLRSGSYPPG
jgi:hypothetical protein